MITRYTHRDITWVDLESPTPAEVREIVDQYRLHPLVGHELTAPTVKPKVDLYPHFIYLILHFPTRHRREKDEGDQEIDFILGKDFIITARYETVDIFHLVSKLFEVKALLDKEAIAPHAGFVFFYILSKMYEGIVHELELMKKDIEEIEGRIFKREELEMVFRLSEVSRELLDVKRAMSLHRGILESFEVAGKKLFGEDFGYYLRTLIGEYYRVDDAIRSNLELLAELRETNHALISTKQNEQIRVITVIAFVTLPLSILTALFQIDAIGRPLIGKTENDFWIFVGILVAISLVLLISFKEKKWL